jgi:dynein heavy chain
LFQLPVIAYLRNPCLEERHWMQIEQVLNYKFEPDLVITLQLLEQIGVFSYGLEMQEISSQASSEAALEALLKKVIFAFVTFLRTVTCVGIVSSC